MIELGLIIIGILTIIVLFTKIIIYVIFDSYESGFGRYGGLIMALFANYDEEEIEDEENPKFKIAKKIVKYCNLYLKIIFGIIMVGLVIILIKF